MCRKNNDKSFYQPSINIPFTFGWRPSPSFDHQTHSRPTDTMAHSLSPSKPSLKILLLHGYTQSPTLFLRKTAALRKYLTKNLPSHNLKFSCPRGPHRLLPADIPGWEKKEDDGNLDGAKDGEDGDDEVDAWGWWRRKDRVIDGKEEVVYEGMEEGLRIIGRCMKDEGPFDGVIGFSQGGCAAGMVTSLLGKMQSGEASIENFVGFLEEGLGAKTATFSAEKDHKNLPPLNFAIVYSGFKAPGPSYESLYSSGIQTPTLHFLGALDSVVEEGRSRALIDVCENAEVVIHPGGHFLPSQRVWMDAALRFVKKSLEEMEDVKQRDVKGAKKDNAELEENVEDMDVPF